MNGREREVRQCATDLLTHLRVAGPPVDPVRIARRQGLVVEERPLPSGVYGALWKKGNRFGIFVSDACPTVGHRRFSVAHELGHYHVDGHVDAMFAGATEMVESAGGFHPGRKSPLEREADWFASELLVPKQQVSRIEGQPASIRILESLAEEFQTSLTMMAIRYAELTDRATASILSRDGHVEWMFCSRRLGEHDWSRTLRKRDPIPPDTATLSLARDLPQLSGGETHSTTGLACDWFDSAPPRLEVEEDAIEMGRYGRVLTLLVVRGLPAADA